MRFLACLGIGSLAMLASVAVAAGVGPKMSPAVRKRVEGAIKMANDRRAAELAQYWNYKGTKISNFRNVKVPNDFIRAFESLDPKPPARLAYYAWLTDWPTLRCNGWHGLIENVEKSGKGYLIKISFTPDLAFPEGGSAATDDAFEEIYAYSGGTISLLGGAGGGVPTRILSLD